VFGKLVIWQLSGAARVETAFWQGAHEFESRQEDFHGWFR
jgi:hypothetical protein